MDQKRRPEQNKENKDAEQSGQPVQLDKEQQGGKPHQGAENR